MTLTTTLQETTKDAATLLVYEAEASFLEVFEMKDDPLRPIVFEDHLTATQAEAEAIEILTRAGYRDPEVTVQLSIAPDEMRAGSYDGVTGIIHGLATGITRDVLIHELAHWCRPRDEHGPQFRAMHATLLGIAFGTDTATELLAAYDDHGLDVDLGWYDPSSTWSWDLLVGAT